MKKCSPKESNEGGPKEAPAGNPLMAVLIFNIFLINFPLLLLNHLLIFILDF